MKNLIKKVEIWAENKGIFEKGTIPAQLDKAQEELNELKQAIECEPEENQILELGDVLITLIILAKMKVFTIEQCLSMAYEKIAKRQGKMINGAFVKEKSVE